MLTGGNDREEVKATLSSDQAFFKGKCIARVF